MPRRILLPRKVAPLAALVLLLALLYVPRTRYALRSLVCYPAHPAHYAEYRHFGIRLPEGYAVHGIDVSRYQQDIDWERVATMQMGDKRVHFAFIKATEGSAWTAPRFEANWRESRRAGLMRGAYHYFLPHLSPEDQFRHFSRVAALKSGDLPPVVDVEERRGMSVSQVLRYTLRFLQLLERRYGVRPILYTNRDFYRQHFAGVTDFERYPLWIAHYYVEALSLPDDRRWHFWQHNDGGRVNGIRYATDFNVFNGDSVALRRLRLR